MWKIEFTRKKAVQITALAALFVVLTLLAVSRQLSLGQAYTRIYFNDEEIACVNQDVDARAILRHARREYALESDHRPGMYFEFAEEQSKQPFVHLMSEEELEASLKQELAEAETGERQRSYSVAIEGYSANFESLDEVYAFLDTVKKPSDEDGQFVTNISKEKGHISGIMSAQLVETNPIERTIVMPEETFADRMVAGITQAAMDELEYAMLNPGDGSYDVGMQHMEFIEKVEVYENYVTSGEIADVDTEVKEVTKEKETNKIYVVESGDCLSVIAMEHETSVKDIVALNGFKNDGVMLRPGQELIIAVPKPDLSLRTMVGEVYEEDYNAEPIIIRNDSWYTTKQVVHDPGTTGHRERNDIVTYENGIEVKRELVDQNIMVLSTPAVIEQGTIKPPTYIKPIAGGRKTSGFGRRWGRLHKGIDWACPVGTRVFASCGGTVVKAERHSSYGNYVLISHPDGRMTRYAHNSKLLVRAGDKVEQGETIALSGNTGRSTGPHVHFEIYINGSPKNPLDYIR